jgi:hypothetical protein
MGIAGRLTPAAGPLAWLPLAAALQLSVSNIVLAEPAPAPATATDERILPYA